MDSDTSLQDLEDEMFDRHKIVIHPKRVSEPSNSVLEQAFSSNKLSLQGAKWSPVLGSNRTASGIPTIAIRVQPRPQQTTPNATTTIHTLKIVPSSLVSKVVSNSSVVAKITSKPQIAGGSGSQISPIIVFPSLNNAPLPPVKNERLDVQKSAQSSSSSSFSHPPSPKIMKLSNDSNNRAEFLKTAVSEANSRQVNLTLQRFVGKPKDAPVKLAKIDYTICSACKKIVESHRLAIHVAMDHGGPGPSPAQQMITTTEQALLLPQPPEIVPKSAATDPQIDTEHDYGNAVKTAGCCPLCNRRVSKDRFNAHLQLVHNKQTKETLDVSGEELARKPFQCLACSARFKLRRTLLRHQQFCGSTDPDAKAHMCENCGACFYDTRSLQAHVTRTHTTQFTCDECSASFRLKRFLQQHKTMKHRKRRPAGSSGSNKKNDTKQGSTTAESEPAELSSNLTVENTGDDEEFEEKLEEGEISSNNSASKCEENGQQGEEVKEDGSRISASKQEIAILVDKSPERNGQTVSLVVLNRSPSLLEETSEKEPPGSSSTTLSSLLKAPPTIESPSKTNSPVTKTRGESTPCKKRAEPKQRKRRQRPEGSTGSRFICRVCGKKSKTQADLNDHEDMHNGIKRHTCDKCDKTYTFKSALWVHRRSHEADTCEPQFGCEFCFEMFRTKQSLMRHKVVKHPESVVDEDKTDQVTCEFCQKTLKNQTALRMHISRGHPELRNGKTVTEEEVEDEVDEPEVEEDERDEDDIPLEIDEEKGGQSSEEDEESRHSDNFSPSLISHTVSAMSDHGPMMCTDEDAQQAPLLICPDDDNVVNELCLV